MRWSRKLVDFWIEHYTTLKDHKITFWQEMDNYSGEVAIHSKGARFQAPFIATSDKNIEFDLAIKSLGKLGAQVFRLYYLDGYDINEVTKRTEYGYTKVEEKVKTVKRELIKYLLESEK